MVNVVVLLQRTLRFLDQLGHAGPQVVTHLFPLLLSGVVVLANGFHIKMSRHNYNYTFMTFLESISLLTKYVNQ